MKSLESKQRCPYCWTEVEEREYGDGTDMAWCPGCDLDDENFDEGVVWQAVNNRSLGC